VVPRETRWHSERVGYTSAENQDRNDPRFTKPYVRVHWAHSVCAAAFALPGRAPTSDDRHNTSPDTCRPGVVAGLVRWRASTQPSYPSTVRHQLRSQQPVSQRRLVTPRSRQ